MSFPKNNPNQDTVAGRTSSQIERAKRQAVGGKRKRCVKGKSCSATCIAANKICLVDIPWVAAQGIPKVVAEVQKAASLPAVAPKPKVKEPDFIMAAGKAPLLPKLNTPEEFKQTLSDTSYVGDKNAEKAHDKIGKLIESTEKAMADARKAIIDKIGGRKVFEIALDVLKRFTDEDAYEGYTRIRSVQHKAAANRPLSLSEKRILGEANNLEALIAKLPKEPLIKYRGMRVSPDTLRDIVSQAQAKGQFRDNALASWSTSLGTAKSFSDMTGGNQNQRVIFRTINRRGVPIDNISSLSGENEVLTSGSAQYKHTGRYRAIEHNGTTYHVFDVIES